MSCWSQKDYEDCAYLIKDIIQGKSQPFSGAGCYTLHKDKHGNRYLEIPKPSWDIIKDDVGSYVTVVDDFVVGGSYYEGVLIKV